MYASGYTCDYKGNYLIKPVGVGCSEHHPFGFQGDQRDEEEETQMKKSESEVEVSTVGAPGI